MRTRPSHSDFLLLCFEQGWHPWNHTSCHCLPESLLATCVSTPYSSVRMDSKNHLQKISHSQTLEPGPPQTHGEGFSPNSAGVFKERWSGATQRTRQMGWGWGMTFKAHALQARIHRHMQTEDCFLSSETSYGLTPSLN